jgi:hypothetical protein
VDWLKDRLKELLFVASILGLAFLFNGLFEKVLTFLSDKRPELPPGRYNVLATMSTRGAWSCMLGFFSALGVMGVCVMVLGWWRKRRRKSPTDSD